MSLQARNIFFTEQLYFIFRCDFLALHLQVVLPHKFLADLQTRSLKVRPLWRRKSQHVNRLEGTHPALTIRAVVMINKGRLNSAVGRRELRWAVLLFGIGRVEKRARIYDRGVCKRGAPLYVLLLRMQTWDTVALWAKCCPNIWCIARNSRRKK